MEWCAAHDMTQLSHLAVFGVADGEGDATARSTVGVEARRRAVDAHVEPNIEVHTRVPKNDACDGGDNDDAADLGFRTIKPILLNTQVSHGLN